MKSKLLSIGIYWNYYLSKLLAIGQPVTPTWVTGCPIAEGHDENVFRSNMVSP